MMILVSIDLDEMLLKLVGLMNIILNASHSINFLLLLLLFIDTSSGSHCVGETYVYMTIEPLYRQS